MVLKGTQVGRMAWLLTFLCLWRRAAVHPGPALTPSGFHGVGGRVSHFYLTAESSAGAHPGSESKATEQTQKSEPTPRP